MPEEQTTQGERVLRVRLDADPASVPGARHFVAEGLRSWGLDDLVDDASLCVSELAGNAALHAKSTYIEVAVLDLEWAVRLLVEDDGPAPLEALAPRTMLPGLDDDFDSFENDLDDLEALIEAPTTGRGLAIVSVLASDWGIEELEHGKRVWADLPAEPAPTHAPTAPHVDAEVAAPSDGSEQLPAGWTVVRLAGCPVELALRQDQHLDELVRELTLMSVGSANPDAAALAERLDAILEAPAHARASGRRQAQAARARGETHVDVEMAVPRRFSSEARRLHEAVQEADVLCDQQRLLTLASPFVLRDFRTWMIEEIIRQAETDAEPTSWEQWQAGR
ncbi:MAG TPA: ATP-binding protein [Nocardioidaceae bacterium]